MISTCRRAHDQYLSPSQPFMEYNPSLFLTLSLHVHFQSNIFIISHLIFLYLMCSCPYSYNRMATAVTYFYYRSLTYHEYILPETNKFNWTTEKRGFDEMFRLLVLCVCFVDRCLFLCPCSFGHCVVCPSLIYGFWLPLWYLQTLLAASANYFFLSLPTMYIVRLLVNKSKSICRNLLRRIQTPF